MPSRGRTYGRAALVAAVTALYVVAALFTFRALGAVVFLLSAVPTQVTSWFFGAWAGLGYALLTVPLNAWLSSINGVPGWQQTLDAWPVPLFILATAGVSGGVERLLGRYRTSVDNLRYMATHDALTGLTNRTQFQTLIDRALAGNRQVAVLYLDLDRYKVVNDSLGHAAGDKLLIAVAGRISACLRPGDTLARFGGDEFAVLLPEVTTAEAERVAERILQGLKESFQIQDFQVSVSASIGVVVGAGNRATAEALLRDADVAMYRAKGAQGGRYMRFQPEMATLVQDKLYKENALHRALQRGELRLYYQPIVSLQTRQIQYLEALVRWEHPTRGLVPPGEFLPVAEESALILELGEWVVAQACRDIRTWQERLETTDLPVVAVNLSTHQFLLPTLAEDISRMVREHGLDHSAIRLEITEGALFEDLAEGIRTIQRLRTLGMTVALDDFGTGYSSLSYLRQLPVDVLKVDRSFIVELGKDPVTEAIVSAIVTLGKTMGMSVTAEGVETPEQVAHLRRLGCDCAQGFYFARPVPADLVELTLKDRQLSPA